MKSSLLTGQVERVATKSLKVHPRNPRKGDLAVIADSLRENLQYSPLVVQSSTRYVLAGNHTLMAARDRLGWSEIDVVMVDVDDERAYRILLSANRTADLGTYDDRLLLGLLADLDTLDGTGYDPEDLAKLEKLLAPPDVGDAPADDGGSASWGVYVVADSRDRQEQILLDLTAQGYAAKPADGSLPFQTREF